MLFRVETKIVKCENIYSLAAAANPGNREFGDATIIEAIGCGHGPLNCIPLQSKYDGILHL